FESMLRPTVFDSVSTVAASAVTETVSVAAGRTSNFVETFCARPSTIDWLFGLKPWSVAVTVYVPGGRRFRLNRPSASVTAVRVPWRLGLFAATDTPGSGVP